MIEILILSLIQGITEFLPVSSSSHLILFSNYVDFENQSLSIDVGLHIGSFIAVVIYFYQDVFDFIKNKKLLLKIFISSLPVIMTGFFLVEFDLINKLRNLKVIGWTTIIFGIILFLSDRCKLSKNLENNFSFKSAIFIGFFQIMSLIPGVSRSGIAITAGRFLNFRRYDASKISFLLSIPILGAVSIFGLSDLITSEDFTIAKLNLASIFLSFVFSFLTIKYFLRYIQKFSLNLFVIYRVLLGIILISITYL